MASTPTIPTFLLPRAISRSTRTFASQSSSPLLRRNATSAHTNKNNYHSSQRRCASTKSSSSKPRVLEKPDKFRPPSHPARRVVNPNAQPRNYPGPPLSAKELEEQQTKRYPNMFPPEGTVMHKFLTNRGIHVWISLGVLVSLATFTYTTNFRATSPYAHLLPSWSHLLTHPIDTVGQFLTVMKMHADHVTLETTEKRKRNVDDVQKRKEYRIAHGLEEPDGTEREAQEKKAAVEGEVVAAVATAGAQDGGKLGEHEDGTYVDWEGKRKPVKKWLGIW